MHYRLDNFVLLLQTMQIEQLYQDYKNMVFNLALQYLQNLEDAEEVTQDVFVQVYFKLDQFRQESKLSTWIYKICVNQCLDFIKAKKAKKRSAQFISIFENQNNDLPFIDFNHPGISLENKESVQRIFNCINELKENQKTVIILSKIEKLNNKEIAEIMNISTKAVESLLFRSKQILENKLKETE